MTLELHYLQTKDKCDEGRQFVYRHHPLFLMKYIHNKCHTYLTQKSGIMVYLIQIAQQITSNLLDGLGILLDIYTAIVAQGPRAIAQLYALKYQDTNPTIQKYRYF